MKASSACHLCTGSLDHETSQSYFNYTSWFIPQNIYIRWRSMPKNHNLKMFTKNTFILSYLKIQIIIFLFTNTFCHKSIKNLFFRIFYTYRIWANLYENFIINQYILRNCRIVISSDYKTLDWSLIIAYVQSHMFNCLFGSHPSFAAI